MTIKISSLKQTNKKPNLGENEYDLHSIQMCVWWNMEYQDGHRNQSNSYFVKITSCKKALIIL